VPKLNISEISQDIFEDEMEERGGKKKKRKSLNADCFQ